jgi:hypothetical protein
VFGDDDDLIADELAEAGAVSAEGAPHLFDRDLKRLFEIERAAYGSDDLIDQGRAGRRFADFSV